MLRERTPDGGLLGIAGNYVEVLLDGGDELMNTFVRGTLAGPLRDGRWRLADMTGEGRL